MNSIIKPESSVTYWTFVIFKETYIYTTQSNKHINCPELTS